MSDTTHPAAAVTASVPHASAAALLTAEHRDIDEGFTLYFLERSEARWGEMLASTLTRLKVHLELEEELFYPLYLALERNDSQYHESLIEHEVIKKLIADIEHSDPADHQYEAMVRVLWKIVARHFVEEENSDGILAFQGVVQADLTETLELRREESSEGMTPSSKF